MLNTKEIKTVRWVPTNLQLADCLTKQGAKTDNLLAVTKQKMRIDHTHLKLVPIRHE